MIASFCCPVVGLLLGAAGLCLPKAPSPPAWWNPALETTPLWSGHQLQHRLSACVPTESYALWEQELIEEVDHKTIITVEEEATSAELPASHDGSNSVHADEPAPDISGGVFKDSHFSWFSICSFLIKGLSEFFKYYNNLNNNDLTY
jgi:hypothetical protein